MATTARYTIDELLKLRTLLPTFNCILEKVNKHPDIAAISRLSDTVVNDQEHSSCQAKTLASITNQRTLSQGSKRRVLDSSEESETLMSSSANTAPETRVQWSLRRRDSSDHSTQPRSAPTGLAAQQSENFQRFYRAVVSPTHVRVTAGGRIVPNTRSTATAPPQLDWNGDRSHIESKNSSSIYESTPWLQDNVVQSAFSQMISTMPVNTGPTTNRIDGQFMTPLEAGNLAGYGAETASNPVPFAALPQPIKISPPSQFDQSKPFIFNGQVVYPVPQGFQPPLGAIPMCLPMLGNPGFLPQPHLANPTGLVPVQFPTPLAPVGNPIMFSGNQQMPMMLPNFGSAEGTAPMGPFHPMQHAIAPFAVEFTKAQIQFLHTQVKFCDHQLANNKHQIDETMVQSQRAMLLSQIHNLETMLDVQLSQAGAYGTGVSGGDLPSGLVPVAPPGSHGAGQVQNTSNIGSAENKPNSQKFRTFSTEPNGNIKSSVRCKTVSKSRLSISAAPFQPRSQALVLVSQVQPANKVQIAAPSPPESPANTDSMAEIEARLLSKSESDWNNSGSLIPNSGPVPFQKARTMHESSSSEFSIENAQSLQRSSTFHSQTVEAPGSALVLHHFTNTVPYLIGTLPHGAQASSNQANDFVYSRPLTDDELRARYLYFGSAPRSVQSGLPKFDGKDFYPPSPVKRINRSSTAQPSFGSSADFGDMSVPLSSFENLFMEPGAPGYKTPSPVRPLHLARDCVPVPQPVFADELKQSPVKSPQASEMHSPCTISNNYGYAGDGSSVPWNPASASSTKSTEIDDFSTLFTERGVPGYKSPAPKAENQKTAELSDKFTAPITPKNAEFSKDTEDKEGVTEPCTSWDRNDTDSRDPSDSDTVVGHPECLDNTAGTPNIGNDAYPVLQVKMLSPKSAHEKAFAERVENFRSSEQQTIFLQNMLRNATQSPMVGSALSGRVSSATAQGYLPQYRGSAAASLAPAMLNHASADHDIDHKQASSDITKEPATGIVNSQFMLSENRPFVNERMHSVSSLGGDSMRAESYMRYLAQKDKRNVDMIAELSATSQLR